LQRKKTGSGAESHGFVQADRFARNTETDPHQPDSDFFAADGILGHSSNFTASDRTWLPERARYLSASAHVEKSPTLVDPTITRVTFASAVGSGSAVAADLAMTARQLDYAWQHDPDSLMVLLNCLADDAFTIQEKCELLIALVTAEPKVLAMCDHPEFQSGSRMGFLVEVAQLAIGAEHWGIAIFATNILRKAAYFHEAKELGEKLYQQLITIFSLLPDQQQKDALAQWADLLIDEDHIAIQAADKLRETETSLQQYNLFRTVRASCQQTLSLARKIESEQDQIKKTRQTIGDIVVEYLKSLKDAVSRSARRLTTGSAEVYTGMTRCEQMKPSTSASVLQVLLEQADGVTGQQQVLDDILSTSAHAALEMAIKEAAARLGQENQLSPVKLLQDPVVWRAAETQYQQFRANLAQSARMDRPRAASSKYK
jgi:hypothetical protein